MALLCLESKFLKRTDFEEHLDFVDGIFAVRRLGDAKAVP